jgi:hypothetical protein
MVMIDTMNATANIFFITSLLFGVLNNYAFFHPDTHNFMEFIRFVAFYLNVNPRFADPRFSIPWGQGKTMLSFSVHPKYFF